MIRNPDWVSSYLSYMDFYSTQPYRYGTHDCFISPCNIVLDMAGVDLAYDLRDYTEEYAVGVLFDNDGVSSILEQKALEHNIPEIPPMMAQRGDIVIGKREGGRGELGIIGPDNRYGYFASPPLGWCQLPIQDLLRAWRI